MINHKTVFVLGAGASVPYNYPSGYTLLRDICKNLVDTKHPNYRALIEMGCQEQDISEFRFALRYSGRNSVDEFLEYQPDFLEIGKSAIAVELMHYENLGHMMSLDSNNWYRYLYNMMSSSFVEFGENAIGVVTFNYDRSFEEYLFTALKHSYGESDDDCAVQIERIPIVHVYGQLGYLPWQKTEPRRPYDASRDPKDVQIAGAGIKIIHEEHDLQFRAAHSILQSAKRVYFLGFGYHPVNMERLDIPSIATNHMKGTAFGLGSAEQQRARNLFGPHSGHIGFSHRHEDVLGFFKEHAVLS